MQFTIKLRLHNVSITSIPPTIARCNYILTSHPLFHYLVHHLLLQIIFIFLESFLYILYCHVELNVYYLYMWEGV